MHKQLAASRQAYVICPRIEDGATEIIKSVTREYQTVKQALHPFRVGLLHGKLKTEEKEAVMQKFRLNEIQVLLATSLIEVGVDVPNATMMLIENAEQFGLAQLHQLRGRIGRGSHEAYCILLSSDDRLSAQERLKMLERTNDGFEIAEADLKFRGPGELLGHQQSGVPDFKFGDLSRDLDLIERARRLALTIECNPN
jgi:ATP-dependent DNA helicase RecG